MAPGEAEAECALLQREGIVDAVLSEDVDTLMFGSGLTLRNWSSEGRGNKSPTHVSAYYSNATKEGKSGLDRVGMILVALMSGGDYIPEGIPGCGIKAACEAARAGFGKSLCQLSKSDTVGLDDWRSNLAHEIQTNESKFFRVKHKALKIPENFPSKEVLGYYTHPVVSSASKVRKLKEAIVWDGVIDIPGLRVFVAEAFEWTHKIGAKKFIRGLAPALLVHKLRLRGDRRASEHDDVVLTAMNEMELVRAICGKRTHFSTDGIPELRVIYHPADIVGLDLDAEKDDREEYGRDGLAVVNDDEDIEAYASDHESASKLAGPTKRAASVYDPTQPNKLWILETIAKVGIPLKVEDYEESLRDPKKFLRAKATARKAATKNGMPRGAMDKFVSISKPGRHQVSGNLSKAPKKAKDDFSLSSLPPAYLAPSFENTTFSTSATRTSVSSRTTRQTRSAALISAAASTAQKKVQPSKTTTNSKTKRKAAGEKPGSNTNPWAIALSSSPSHCLSVTKNLGQTYQKTRPPSHFELPEKAAADYELNSSLPSSPPLHSASYSRKHAQYPPPNSQNEPEEDVFAHIAMSRGVGQADHHLNTPPSTERDQDRLLSRNKHSPPAPSTVSSSCLPPQFKPGDITSDLVHLETNLSSITRARSSSPDLPALEELAQPTNKRRANPSPARVISLLSSPPEIKTGAKEKFCEGIVHQNASKGPKKYIMLNESLLGSWKEADISELVRGKSLAWRYSQVEFLDLSAE